jgi:hypothetical protein
MADTDEIEIPDSDDAPDDASGDDHDDEAVTEEADDEPHGHAHTPGYPAHRHTGDGIKYDAGQVNVSGGLDMFPEDRHDSDSAQARGLQDEREDLANLSPLIATIEDAARDAGWEVEEVDHPSRPGGVILGLTKNGTNVSASVALTE